jgi:hypothetical protein
MKTSSHTVPIADRKFGGGGGGAPAIGLSKTAYCAWGATR